MKLFEDSGVIRPDSRGGTSYGNVDKNPASYQTADTFPYTVPPENIEGVDDLFSEPEDLDAFVRKVNLNHQSVDSSAKIGVDRNSFFSSKTRFNEFKNTGGAPSFTTVSDVNTKPYRRSGSKEGWSTKPSTLSKSSLLQVMSLDDMPTDDERAMINYGIDVEEDL